MMILLFRTRAILTAAAPMIILAPVISTPPTNWLLQIPKRRVSTISVTMAPLNELTGEVMNTTMDEDSFGTLLMDDPGDDDLHAGLWWTDVDCAMRSYVHDYGG